jgi:hypothetical protein
MRAVVCVLPLVFEEKPPAVAAAVGLAASCLRVARQVRP